MGTLVNRIYAQESALHLARMRFIENDSFTTEESKRAINDCKFTMREGLLEIGFSTRKRLQSLLEGDDFYGVGAHINARQILMRTRSNRCAQLITLLCALNNCAKSVHVRKAYNQLTTQQQDELNALVKSVIEEEKGVAQ